MIQSFIEKIAASQINKYLRGKRTHLLGVGLIAQGVVSILQSEAGTADGVTSIVTGLGLIFARVGASNEAKAVKGDIK